LSPWRFLHGTEPLASLDAARREEILPWLERLRDLARMPMIYVSHAVEEVARLADQVVLLEAGQVIAQGPASLLLIGAVSSGALLGGLLDAVVTGPLDDGLTGLAFDGGTVAMPLTA